MKHENYRHYLLGEFESRKIRNPGYSLRAFARDLKTSPSRLSEALNGKRGISDSLADRWIEKLGLQNLDAEIFRLSVESEHARSPQRKKIARDKLKLILENANSEPLKTFTVVDWISEAVLKMSERESVTTNVGKTATRLNVPEFMVIEALRFLTRLGFIAGAKSFKTYLQNRGKDRKLNVDYLQILEQAQKAYVLPTKGDHFDHKALLLGEREMEKAVLILRKAIGEIRKLENPSKRSKVVFIANQLFSLERERSSQ